MMPPDPLNAILPAAPAQPVGPARPLLPGRFRLPTHPASAAAPALATQSLPGLLLVQEAADPVTRDRAARRHGARLLAALRQLQLGLLDGPCDLAPLLETLASLATAVPAAADPGLAEAVAATALRARVELARRTRA